MPPEQIGHIDAAQWDEYRQPGVADQQDPPDRALRRPVFPHPVQDACGREQVNGADPGDVEGVTLRKPRLVGGGGRDVPISALGRQQLRNDGDGEEQDDRDHSRGNHLAAPGKIGAFYAGIHRPAGAFHKIHGPAPYRHPYPAIPVCQTAAKTAAPGNSVRASIFPLARNDTRSTAVRHTYKKPLHQRMQGVGYRPRRLRRRSLGGEKQSIGTCVG